MNGYFPITAAAAGWLVACAGRTGAIPVGTATDHLVVTPESSMALHYQAGSTAASLLNTARYDAMRMTDTVDDFVAKMMDRSIFSAPGRGSGTVDPEPQARQQRDETAWFPVRCEQYGYDGCQLGNDPGRPRLCEVDSYKHFGRIWVDCTVAEYEQWLKNNLPKTHVCKMVVERDNSVRYLQRVRCTREQYERQVLAHPDWFAPVTARATTVRPVRSQICREELTFSVPAPDYIYFPCTAEQKADNEKRYGQVPIPEEARLGKAFRQGADEEKAARRGSATP